MFTSMTARVSTNTYCLAGTQRFSRRSENSVGRVTHKREAPTDTVQLVFKGCTAMLGKVACWMVTYAVLSFFQSLTTATLLVHTL